MEESEKQPLLLGKSNKDGKPENRTCLDIAESQCKRRIVIGVAMYIAVACAIITVALGGTAAFGVKFALYKSNNSGCQSINHSPTKGAQSRSGSYSILYTIASQDVMCYARKPQLLLSLEDRDSSVEIYQTSCQNIETQAFRMNYHFTDLPSAEGSRPLFDENFSPQNYFMNGNMQVDIINATTTLPPSDIHLCLFSNNYEYNRFLRAGIKWKNHTESATCITMTATKNGETDDSAVLFNISQPAFAFLGLATTYPVQIDLINITAIGRDISSLGENSTKVCQLNGEVTTCNLSLPDKQLLSKNQSTCIVAYQEGNPDGTYDYSNLTISIPNQVKQDNPYKKKLTIYGFASLGVIVIISMLFMLIVVIVGIITITCMQSNATPDLDQEQRSIQSAEVTCDPIEDTTRHDPKTERPLMSVTGIEQILQKSQYSKHQSPGEGISGDQDAALHDRSGPISVGLEESLGQRACTGYNSGLN